MNEPLKSYLEAALWSSAGMEGDGCEYLDEKYTVEDFAPSAVEAAAQDIAAFLANPKVKEALEHPDFPEEFDAGHVGHNLWLTRNGHGTGYWDRDELEPNGWGDTLSEVAHAMGEKYPEVGDDGRVYFS